MTTGTHVDEDLYRRLLGLARRLCGDASEAEDVVQEVLMRAAERDAQLRDVRRRDAWLLRICRHAAIDHVRARRVRRTVWLPMSPEAAAQARVAAAPTSRRVVRDVVDERVLPAHQRLLLDLHYAHGKGQSSLCRMTGLSPCALRVRLYRARGVLIEAASRPGSGVPPVNDVAVSTGRRRCPPLEQG